jgi:hypothetical protein
MAHVPLEPVLVLPAPAPEDADAIERADDAASSSAAGAAAAGQAAQQVAAVPSPTPAAGTRYGLYAVVVHRGESANSGHYYTIARRSDAPGADVGAADSPAAPWCVFNDTQVTPGVPWAEWTEALATSATDRAYVLFYRRLSGDLVESHDADGAARASQAGGGGVLAGATVTGSSHAAAPELTPAAWTRRVLLDNVRLAVGWAGGDHSANYADLADAVRRRASASARAAEGATHAGTGDSAESASTAHAGAPAAGIDGSAGSEGSDGRRVV